MCLAIPTLLVERLPNEQAIVNLGGIRKPISIALVPEAQVGDYVIVHVGHAIGIVDPEEAAYTLAMFAEMQVMAEDLPSAGSPQACPAPSGRREPHTVGSVGAEVLK